MGNARKSGPMLLRALRGVGWLLLGVAVLAGVRPAAAQTPSRAIYGPFSVTPPGSSLFS